MVRRERYRGIRDVDDDEMGRCVEEEEAIALIVASRRQSPEWLPVARC